MAAALALFLKVRLFQGAHQLVARHLRELGLIRSPAPTGALQTGLALNRNRLAILHQALLV